MICGAVSLGSRWNPVSLFSIRFHRGYEPAKPVPGISSEGEHIPVEPKQYRCSIAGRKLQVCGCKLIDWSELGHYTSSNSNFPDPHLFLAPIQSTDYDFKSSTLCLANSWCSASKFPGKGFFNGPTKNSLLWDVYQTGTISFITDISSKVQNSGIAFRKETDPNWFF